MITWAEAELDFRGLGPPPVPSKMSLVLADWASVRYGSETVASNVALRARNARRLQGGMRHYAEKQEGKQTQKAFFAKSLLNEFYDAMLRSIQMPDKPVPVDWKSGRVDWNSLLRVTDITSGCRLA
jgi:hypothetical protein